MVETLTQEVPLALAHIIERPRLIERLEEGSRVSVFAAPAGFGKTTLARQWGEKQDCPVVWYRTNRASGDVALLAVQFDELLTRLAPDLATDPGKVAAIAAANPSPSPLGRALVRQFGGIEDDILLIVDEWEAAETPESDELLSMLVDGIPVRWVITSRERPRWFAPRKKIYGEALEIGVEDLRMTDEEAVQVLAAAGAESGRAKVMRTAAGWPAVLGLAAMSGEVDFTSDELLSQTLDEFLAQELLAAATAETQEALMLLAISSIVDIPRAELLLGKASARKAISEASARGLVAVNGDALFVHPLLRDLLIRRFREAPVDARGRLLDRCRSLFDSNLWDEALSVAETSEDAEFIAAAVATALDQILEAGRTSSLERWVQAARRAGVQTGPLDYAEAELCLRQGGFDRAVALGGCAGRTLSGDLSARAHLVAARAAHLGNRATLVNHHLSCARSAVQQPETEADFKWLRVAAAIEEERPGIGQLVESLVKVDARTHSHALRIATANLHRAFTEGSLPEHIDAAEGSVALVKTASDPYASTALLNALSYALLAAGRFIDALAAADLELAIAEEVDLPFVVPHAETNRLCALVALREFPKARRVLSAIEKHIDLRSDPFLASQHAIQSAALEIARGNLDRALDHLALPDDPRAPKGTQGVRHGMRSLVLAALAQFDGAEDEMNRALKRSQRLETRAFLFAATAVRAAIQGEDTKCVDAYEEIINHGFPYVLHLAWRARFEVAQVLLRSGEHRDSVVALLFSANDTAIAKRAGASVPRPSSRRLDLSAREEEVCELLAEGRTNQEIAEMLFISLSTTKVHVKHILEKLGVRSRLDAARIWEERAS